MAKSSTRICNWLLSLFKGGKYLRFREIEKRWLEDESMSDYGDLTKRKFHLYKDMLKRRFGVSIGCKDKMGYAYYITNADIYDDPNVPEFMLNTMMVDEKLHECISIMDRFMTEYIPSGGVRLDVVTDTMLENKKIYFEYQKYGSPSRNPMELGVCGLMLYKQRWYILGEFDDKKRYTFALDRMWNVRKSTKNFKVDPSFNIYHYFSDIYGIYHSGKPLTNIIIRAFGDEPYYMNDLRIHHSQKEIGSGEGYRDYMIKVSPNNELVSYLLGRRDRVKVLSPDGFEEEMKDAIRSMAELYGIL